MGLRDLFRGGKTATPTPQPSHGDRPGDPTAQRGADEAERAGVPGGEPAARTSGAEHSAEPLPESGSLRNLVDLLLSRGADRAQLTLVQSGNIMTHQTRQAVGQAPDEVENGTVDQGSPLFDDVADLYTQAMGATAGPWRQLDLVVEEPENGHRDVRVTYDFPNGESRTERYRQGGGRDPQASGDGAPFAAQPAADTAQETRQPQGSGPGEAPAADVAVAAGGVDGTDVERADRGAQDSAPGDENRFTGAGASDDRQDAGVRVVEEDRAQPVEDGDVVAGGRPAPVVHHDAAAATGPDAEEGADAEAGAGADPSSLEQSRDLDGDEQAPTAEAPETDAAVGGRSATEDSAPQVERVPAPAQETDAQDGRELPDHVDESAFGAGAADPLLPVAGPANGGDDLSGAPQLATATDVSPSYQAPAAEQQADPDALAPGNLVLSVGDVRSRLADAQRRLFGPEGTARDVSTVLIRVRALGTYYDALTHVRLNGFWDQRPTFDLVPEEQLHVQELKDDSYVEGSGAPLAMMFRFRPGVPPEVTFDYSDEEAFVRYEQRLPGQNYLEELRMYPRTGSNIPQHVNEALQDWNY